MKYFFTAVVFAFLTISSNAQHKIVFSSQNYAGLLEGENKSAFQLQTINGFKYKTWFAGLGTGLDWYYQRSIPMFASINKGFLKKGERNLFISADGGLSFPWKRDNAIEWNYGSNGKFYPGLYWSSGLGYKIGIGKNSDAVLLHVGYSYKHLIEKNTIVNPCFNPPCPESTERYDFRLRRLSLKLGWNF